MLNMRRRDIRSRYKFWGVRGGLGSSASGTYDLPGGLKNMWHPQSLHFQMDLPLSLRAGLNKMLQSAHWYKQSLRAGLPGAPMAAGTGAATGAAGAALVVLAGASSSSSTSSSSSDSVSLDERFGEGDRERLGDGVLDP